MADHGLTIHDQLDDPGAHPDAETPGHELLDDYVTALSRHLSWRPDHDDLVAEAADHLWLATERLVRDGTDRERAHREVLERFGDPRVVALAHATSSPGGQAMPTRATRAAGAVGAASAVGFMLYGIALAVSGVLQFDLVRFGSVAAALTHNSFTMLCYLLIPVTTVALVGLVRRSGASWSDPLLWATAALGATSPALGVMYYKNYYENVVDRIWLPVGLALQLVTICLAAMAVRRLHQAGIRRLRTDWLLPAAFPLGVAIGAALMPFGPAFTPDNAPTGMLFGAASWPLLFGVGMLRRSQWLAAEPAPLAEVPVTDPLDLQWGCLGAVAIAVGIAGVVQAAGYVVAKVLGFSGFLYAAVPGPAATAALFAVVLLPLGVTAARRAAEGESMLGGGNDDLLT